MANPFVHLELNTPDLTAAKKFYGALFGWTFQDMDMGPGGIYSTFKPDTGPGGGMMSMAERKSRLARLCRCRRHQCFNREGARPRSHHSRGPA